MVFTVPGAVAELERSRIVERRVAERPREEQTLGGIRRKIVDMGRIATLRVQGVGWKRIAAGMGVGVGTIYCVALEGSKTPEKVF